MFARLSSVAVVSIAMAVLYLATQSSALAATVHDETVDGDLSTDANAPTSVSLNIGINTVSGTMQAPGDIRDYLTFSIGADQQLSQIRLLNYVDLPGGGPGDTGYATINAGATSFEPSGGNIGNFLGDTHVDTTFLNGDILAAMGASLNGSTGFSGPLGAGSYTFNIQQTGTELTGYTLDFIVVPEPSGVALVLLAVTGILGLLSNRRRYRA